MSQRAVTVVGGGVAGLVVAIHAARGGARVELLEARARPGGRARTREEAGFRFNLGPHALYVASEAGKGLAELGIRLVGVRPAASGGLARARGRLHALPVGPLSLLTTGLLEPRAKLELGRWLAALPRLEPAALDGVPLDAALATQLSTESSRAVVRALVRLTSYTHAPSTQSAGAALGQLREAQGGVLYLEGGWIQLVERLEARAREEGVRLHARTRVRSAELRGRRHALLSSDGRTFEADAVVLALGPTEVRALVGGGSDPVLRDLAERCTPVRAAVLDLGLSSLPRPDRTFCLGIDAPCYFSVHSVARGLAPEGAAQIQVARYLAPDEKPERASLERELGALVDQLQPGWRTRVVTQRFATELRVSEALVTARHGGLAGRAPVALEQRPGTFLAGDWVGAQGQLVDASFASGRAAGTRAARGG